MKITANSWITIMQDLTATENCSQLLKTLRENKENFEWDHIDLFLYSMDLGGFYFPPETTADPDESVRNEFTAYVDEFGSNFEDVDAKVVGELISRKTGHGVLLIELFPGREQPVGFVFLSYEHGNKPDGKELEEAYATCAMCEPSLKIHTLRDLSRKYELENRIIRQEAVKNENLKLLGEMIGGITHDFNNILTGVIGFAQLVEMMEEDEDNLDSVREILKAAQKGKEMVSFISETKKVQIDEEVKELEVVDLLKQAVDGLNPLITVKRPVADYNDLISINAVQPITMETQPVLFKGLIMHILTTLFNHGSKEVNIRVSGISGDSCIDIDSVYDEAEIRPAPVSVLKEQDGRECRVLELMTDALGFDLEVENGTVRIMIGARQEYADGSFLGLRFLIIERNEALRKLYSLMFNKIGADSDVFERLDDALDEMSGFLNRYDAILVDEAAVSELNQLRETEKATVCIYVSALGEHIDFDRLAEKGVDHVMLKPFKMKTMGENIRRFLRKIRRIY